VNQLFGGYLDRKVRNTFGQNVVNHKYTSKLVTTVTINYIIRDGAFNIVLY